MRGPMRTLERRIWRPDEEPKIEEDRILDGRWTDGPKGTLGDVPVRSWFSHFLPGAS